MTDHTVIPVKPEIAAGSRVDEARRRAMVEEAGRDPEGFWRREMGRIAWMRAPRRIKNTSFEGDVSIRWFEDGVLNISESCLDRHVDGGRGDQVAILWEGDDPNADARVTYRDLLAR
ncbi:acetyl-coenzyme A synthetase, partial [Roseomonas nepalensis]